MPLVAVKGTLEQVFKRMGTRPAKAGRQPEIHPFGVYLSGWPTRCACGAPLEPHGPACDYADPASPALQSGGRRACAPAGVRRYFALPGSPGRSPASRQASCVEMNLVSEPATPGTADAFPDRTRYVVPWRCQMEVEGQPEPVSARPRWSGGVLRAASPIVCV